MVTSRERVLAAFEHREADRVPLDLAATGASLIHARVYRDLLARLGLPEEPDVHRFKASGMVIPGESVRRRFGNDIRQVGLEMLDTWRQVDESNYVDEWGVRWERSDGGEPAAMGAPFQEGEPTPTDIEGFDWPAADDPVRYPDLQERVRRIRTDTDCAILFDFHYGIVRECQRLRGFSEWLTDLLVDPALAEALMEHVLHTVVGIADHALSLIGDDIDIFFFYDDMGLQDRPYMRPDLYRQMVKPYHRRLVEAVRARTRAHVMMHSDGAIADLLPDLIDVGVEAINPVQVAAAGMETADLKARFGQNLVFWGAIDIQHVLPFGSPDDVRVEVRSRLRDLAPGGGYVLAPGHNIQVEVPADNVIAMFDAAREFGRYPIS